MNVPVTTCERVDTPDWRVLDLSGEGLPEIPVLGMRRSPRTAEGSFFHRHACFEITYCAHGRVTFDCDGRTYSIVPGKVFLSRPGDVHRLRVFAKGSKLFWIFLRFPMRGESFLKLNKDESRWLVRSLNALSQRVISVSPDVGAAYERLFEICDTEGMKPAARRLKLRLEALRLLTGLADAEAASKRDGEPEDARFQQLVNRMRREPQRALSMSEMAAALHCPPNAVRALFRAHVGVSPRSFTMKCRIRKAQDLLRMDTLSITDIACELGFSSSQNFAIRFRQETGQSPTAWRVAHA